MNRKDRMQLTLILTLLALSLALFAWVETHAETVTCPDADRTWTYLEQTRAGDILSQTDVCWYADPTEVGCWKDLDECTDAVRDQCRLNGADDVRWISLRRSKVKGELTDECSGECDSRRSHTVTLICSKTPPRRPKPEPVTGGR